MVDVKPFSVYLLVSVKFRFLGIDFGKVEKLVVLDFLPKDTFAKKIGNLPVSVHVLDAPSEVPPQAKELFNIRGVRALVW